MHPQGPLMLELGVCPEVAAATSATMILFTSAAAAIVYLHFGGLPTDYAAALLCLGFCCGISGQLACNRLVRMLQRRSVIVFAMAALMVLATAAGSWQAATAVRGAAADGSMWHWGSVCMRAGVE